MNFSQGTTLFSHIIIVNFPFIVQVFLELLFVVMIKLTLSFNLLKKKTPVK